jgi:hypothetical protein
MYLPAVEAANPFVMDSDEADRCFLHLDGDFALTIHAGRSKYIKKAILELFESTGYVCHDGFVVLVLLIWQAWIIGHVPFNAGKHTRPHSEMANEVEQLMFEGCYTFTLVTIPKIVLIPFGL